MVWWFIVVFIVAVVVSYAMAPRAPEPIPPSVREVSNVPTAEAGRPIPVIFGTYVVKSSNIVWYGDLAYKPIKKKSKGGK